MWYKLSQYKTHSGQMNLFFNPWFGDSKIIDEQGQPLPVYHGTRSPEMFTQFDIDRTEVGPHFGTYEQATNRNLGRTDRLFTVYLKIENPIQLDDAGEFNTENILNNMVERHYITKKQCFDIENQYLNILYKNFPDILANIKHKSYTNPIGDFFEYRSPYSMLYNKEFRTFDLSFIRNKLISMGYDGIIYANENEGNGYSYIVFSPNQIKDINDWEFNPDDPNIITTTRKDTKII